MPETRGIGGIYRKCKKDGGDVENDAVVHAAMLQTRRTRQAQCFKVKICYFAGTEAVRCKLQARNRELDLSMAVY